MTLKIEIACDGDGDRPPQRRIEEDHLVELQAEVQRCVHGSVRPDGDDAGDLAAVRFLAR